MGRALLILAGAAERAKALRWIAKAPVNTRLTFQGPVRTLEQSDKMWAMLTDLAQQLRWHGQKMSAEDFKVLLMAGLNQELRLVPNIEGTGFVPLGRSSSKLSKAEMSDLLDLIAAFGAQHGVTFHEPAGVPSESLERAA